MSDLWIMLVGMSAAVCTTASFVPQVFKTLRTRRTADISLHMYIILSTGLFLWLLYGLLTGDPPLIMANAVSFSLAFGVLILKIRHG